MNKVNMIMAMDKNGAIGINNDLPWHLPNDLQYFKRMTSNKCVVMGRKTYESIGHPLPNRINVVLTRDRDFTAPRSVWVYHSPTDLLKDTADSEIFVIGGSNIFKIFMPFADQLLITHIDHEFEADTFMDIDYSCWQRTFKTPGVVDYNNKYEHNFVGYKRKEIPGCMKKKLSLK